MEHDLKHDYKELLLTKLGFKKGSKVNKSINDAAIHHIGDDLVYMNDKKSFERLPSRAVLNNIHELRELAIHDVQVVDYITEVADAIYRARLTPIQARTLYLHYWECMTLEEIGELLGKTKQGAFDDIKRGIKNIEKELRK